jgi:transporter family protein
MSHWLWLAMIAVVLWGVVGLLQKVTTNHLSADAVLIWDRIGYLLVLPFLLVGLHLGQLGAKDILIGTLDGVINSLGALYLYKSLQSGAKASIAVPLTALYPLLTVVLAVIILGERLNRLHWFGVGLALVASVLISMEGSPKEMAAATEVSQGKE